MSGLTIRGYARHRGVSHTAVRKALATGRITASPDGTIDPVAADRQWGSSTDFSKPSNSLMGSSRNRIASAVASDPLGSPGIDDGLPPPPGDVGVSRLAASYAASRAVREAYVAKLAKLDFEQRSGKLVDADEVRVVAFEQGRRARKLIEPLGARLGPVLAGISDPEACRKIIDEEIAAICDEMAGLNESGIGARNGK